MFTNESVSIIAPARSRKPGRGVINSSISSNLKLSAAIVFVAVMFGVLLPKDYYQFQAATQGALIATASGFPYSTPITLNNEGTQLWVTNPDPDNNSVTVVNVANDAPAVLAEIPVGHGPSSVALNGDGSRAYVANTLDGTISVINTQTRQVLGAIRVGVEPRALCFTPNFTKLYVACSSSNNIFVINPNANAVSKVIDNPSFNNPFAMTVTNDGDADDADELLYVTNLLAEYVPGSAPRPGRRPR